MHCSRLGAWVARERVVEMADVAAPAQAAPKPAPSTVKLSADSHHMGHVSITQSPLVLVIMFLMCLVGFFVFSILQVTSTEQAILGLLQFNLPLNPGMTAAQLSNFIKGNLDKADQIANAIGWSVQFALLSLSLPPDSALLRVHKMHGKEMPASLVESAVKQAKLKKFMMSVLIGGDVITDFVYVVAGHTIVTFSGFMPNISGSGFGVMLVALLYPIAICFITIFAGKWMFVYLEALIEKVMHGN